MCVVIVSKTDMRLFNVKTTLRADIAANMIAAMASASNVAQSGWMCFKSQMFAFSNTVRANVITRCFQKLPISKKWALECEV